MTGTRTAGSHGVSTCAGPWLMTGFERKKEELIPRWDGGGGPSSVQLPGQEQVSEDCYQCLRDRYKEFYTTLLYICFFFPVQASSGTISSCNPRNFATLFVSSSNIILYQFIIF